MSEIFNMLKKINVAISLQRYELAIKLSRKLLAMEPNNVFAYYFLSQANLYLKRLDDAEKFVKLALFYEPNLENSLLLYSAIMFAKEQYQSTIDKANEVLKINPQNETAIYFKACALYELEDYKKAECYLKQALSVDPISSTMHLKLADIYSDTNKKKLAEHEYLEALKLNPNASATLNNYGLHLLKQNWYSKKGLELLRSSLKNEPNDKKVINNYKVFSTFQNLLFITLKSYKEIFEHFFSKKDMILFIILSGILYLLNNQICTKIAFIIVPFFILYAITFIFVKNNNLRKK